MTIYSSPGMLAKSSGQVHGEARSTNRLHETIALPATLATGDVINVGYLPVSAVVAGLMLKAASQLDANPTPALAFDVGTPSAPQMFNAVSTVGRAAGSSADIALLPVGLLYKNGLGVKQLVIVTVHAAATTPVAGLLEVQMTYFIEDTAGSPA